MWRPPEILLNFLRVPKVQGFLQLQTRPREFGALRFLSEDLIPVFERFNVPGALLGGGGGGVGSPVGAGPGGGVVDAGVAGDVSGDDGDDVACFGEEDGVGEADYACAGEMSVSLRMRWWWE